MPARTTALHTRSGKRLPIDGDVEVVMREKARFTTGIGWTYRYQSNGVWMLTPLDSVESFEFAEKPEGMTEGARPVSGRVLPSRRPSSAALYVDDL
jgi:hypothetical protein